MSNAKNQTGSSKNAPVRAALIFKNPVMFLAFGGGSGLAPKAPGTAGTVVAIPIAIMLSPLSFLHEVVIISVMFLVGVGLCNYATGKLGVHDHSGIVWDEIVGYLIAVLFVPHSWIWWLTGFVLFRFFDIVKPWPIRELDHRISGGFGIMLDDVVAGIFAAIVLAILQLGRHLM
ncbi:MAG: phosphatidylglycerophosphatase A [Gammaproteobacteria bacterium]|nr:phosphatidylglycerophosphatase A [Gammaproteobacteria bacterium]